MTNVPRRVAVPKQLTLSLKEPTPEQIRQAERIFAGTSIPGANSFIGVPRVGQPYATGTLSPLIQLARGVHQGAAGILLPGQEPDFRYLRAFLGLDEYFGPFFDDVGESLDLEAWVGILLHQYPKEILVTELAFLNHAAESPDLRERIYREYPDALPPDLARHFHRAMAKNDAGARAFLARQPLLRALRLALLHDGPVGLTLPFLAVHVAILLSHAVASTLRVEETKGPELLPGIAGDLAMEVMANYLFNQQEDLWARLDRFDQIWGDYGASVPGKYRLRATADELVREATGVDRRDLFAVAVSLATRPTGWQPGSHYRWQPDFGIGMDEQRFDKCLRLLATNVPELQAELRTLARHWQMLPFERHPVLLWDDGSAVVLDVDFLWTKVTSGLYWMVLEHEEATLGNTAANRWSQAYGDMWERWAEDRLRAMAPVVLGGSTFYTEEEIGSAYRGKKTDLAIDFGRAIALCEVQKGQVSLDHRQALNIQAFIDDTERLVMRKLKQVDTTAKAVLADPARLLGYVPPTSFRVYPILVLGITYPLNPLAVEYIEVIRKERDLLTSARVTDLAIIDAAELEMLEGLWEARGVSIVEAIEDWKRSGGFRFSLRNHLLERYGGDPMIFRAARMDARVSALFEDVKDRLKLADPPTAADDVDAGN